MSKSFENTDGSDDAYGDSIWTKNMGRGNSVKLQGKIHSINRNDALISILSKRIIERIGL